MVEEKYSPAVNLLAQQMEARVKIRKQWKDDAGDLLFAHEAAVSAIATMVSRFSDKMFEKASESAEGRLTLTSQFIVGIDLCERAISEGVYTTAAALLKQEMEIIEAVHEFEVDKRVEGKTPRIGGRLGDFGRLYGLYDEIAHVGKALRGKEIVQSTDGQKVGASTVPIYDKERTATFYGMHTLFVTVVAIQMGDLMNELYGEGLNDEEKKFLVLSRVALEKEDIIDIEYPPSD